MNVSHLRMTFLLMWVATFVPTVSAAEKSLSMSVGDFRDLSAADRHAVVVSAFEQRLKHALNLHYESTTHGRIQEYKDGAIGATVEEFHRDDFRRWQLGDSYRMDIDRFGTPSVGDPIQRGSTGLLTGMEISKDRPR